MIDIKEYGKFQVKGKSKEKKQIILCHTSREVGEYLTSLKFRYNKNFNKIPNFVVTREGEVLKLLSELSYTDYFYEENININSIIISLENLGWLEKKPLSNQYINWNGYIYNGEPYEKKWREYFFWHPYTEIQMKNTFELCESLCEKFGIKKICTGHNTKIEGIENFEGIVSKSNYNSRFTDLNPSFNFGIFKI
jgi:hypothetical protein